MQRRLSPRALLGILTGLNLFNYLDRFVLPAVLPSLQQDLGLDDAQCGRINTAFMLGYFLTSPIFGYLGDRTSRKWLIAAGIAVWSLGTVGTGFAHALFALFAFRVLVGLGEASYATISPSLISDTFPKERRNNALTIFYAAIPVGAALGNILGGAIADASGWRAAFVWAGAPGLVLALLLLPFAEPRRGGADPAGGAGHAKPKPSDVLRLCRLPEYVLVVLGYTAYTCAIGAFAFWGPSFLHRVHGIAQDSAAQFFGAVLVVAGLVGTLAGGFAATAWQKRNRLAYGLTLGLSTLAAIPVAIGAFLAGDATTSMACLAIAMFFLFLSTGPVNTLIVETVPVNLRASAMALSIFAIHLGGDMWSPEIVGRLSDGWGSLQRALLVLPAALLVGALLWLALVVVQRRKLARAAA
jgi:MFS transporter, Spinster family, sphingosine-1-phosphate transporter